MSDDNTELSDYLKQTSNAARNTTIDPTGVVSNNINNSTSFSSNRVDTHRNNSDLRRICHSSPSNYSYTHS